MKAHSVLAKEFDSVVEQFGQSAVMRRISDGLLSTNHYKAILREVFHYSREDPQLQAAAAIRFRGEDRNMVKMFLRHAFSEVGHDQLALADLRVLGVDTSNLHRRRPLPTTSALIGFAFHQVEHGAAVSYLGYLYFLEHLPTRGGEAYITALRAAGIPSTAMTFLLEHATVDVRHNQLMKHYVSKLVRDEDDLSEIIYAMRTTSILYAAMLRGAVDDADAPFDYGESSVEQRGEDGGVDSHGGRYPGLDCYRGNLGVSGV